MNVRLPDAAEARGTRASSQARRAGLASFVGTTIEWYDF